MDQKEFGLFMCSLRIKRGYESQRKLAIASGISPSTLLRIEDGTSRATPETLKKLAPYLRIPYEKLMEKAGYISSTIKEARPPYGSTENPDFDYVLQEKNLADALLKISELLFKINIDDETLLKLVRKATEKYGLPKVENSEPAAHGPKTPGTGVFDNNGHK